MMTLGGLYQRLMFVIGRGKITYADVDDGPVQLAQIDFGPVGPGGSDAIRNRTPILGSFGFASRAPVGSDVVAVFIGGSRSSGAVIASSHRDYRKRNLGIGDAALYDKRGASVWLTADGLVIDGAGLPAVVKNVGSLTVEGDLFVTGNITDLSLTNSKTVADLREAYDAHAHTGVAAGSSTSGPTTREV